MIEEDSIGLKVNVRRMNNSNVTRYITFGDSESLYFSCPFISNQCKLDYSAPIMIARNLMPGVAAEPYSQEPMGPFICHLELPSRIRESVFLHFQVWGESLRGFIGVGKPGASIRWGQV